MITIQDTIVMLLETYNKKQLKQFKKDVNEFINEKLKEGEE